MEVDLISMLSPSPRKFGIVSLLLFVRSERKFFFLSKGRGINELFTYAPPGMTFFSNSHYIIFHT